MDDKLHDLVAKAFKAKLAKIDPQDYQSYRHCSPVTICWDLRHDNPGMFAEYSDSDVEDMIKKVQYE